MLWRDRYLFWIAVLTVLLNTVNTSGEYVLGRLLQDESIRRYGADLASEAQRGRFIGMFYGSFLIWTNTVGLLTQLLLVSRLIRYAGVRKSSVRSAVHLADQLFRHSLCTGPGPGSGVESSGELHRLLSAEHRPAGALAAHDAGGQVQGEGRRRHFLRANGGRAGRRRCVRGKQRGRRVADGRRMQRGAGALLALGGEPRRQGAPQAHGLAAPGVHGPFAGHARFRGGGECLRRAGLSASLLVERDGLAGDGIPELANAVALGGEFSVRRCGVASRGFAIMAYSLTAAPFTDMRLDNKSVLVTGADGFIGSRLVEELVARGARVTAMAQYNSFNYWGWLEDIPVPRPGPCRDGRCA